MGEREREHLLNRGEVRLLSSREFLLENEEVPEGDIVMASVCVSERLTAQPTPEMVDEVMSSPVWLEHYAPLYGDNRYPVWWQLVFISIYDERVYRLSCRGEERFLGEIEPLRALEEMSRAEIIYKWDNGRYYPVDIMKGKFQ